MTQFLRLLNHEGVIIMICFLKQKRGLSVVLLTTLLLSASAFAQSGPPSTAQVVQNLIERSKPSIVKLVVEGRDPNDNYKKAYGSGFFIFSGQGVSLILTAAHVIGSNETLQASNPDWKVDNGIISRKISLWSFDDKGSLVLRSTGVSPGAPFPGIDVALLQINQAGYASLPLAKVFDDVSGLHDALLLGFEGERSELPIPPLTGMGQLTSPLTFGTSAPSRPGQSGGAWIDLKSGLVLAVARGVQAGANGPSFEATPATAIQPFVAAYFPPPPPPPVRAVYKICSGEYKGPCPSDSIYQYCYYPVENWAKDKCSSYTISRLATFGGNKCGYSVDEIVCTLK